MKTLARHLENEVIHMMINGYADQCVFLPGKPDLWWSFSELWQWVWSYLAWLFLTPHLSHRYSSRRGETVSPSAQLVTGRQSQEFNILTSSDSDRNSCMMSLSPMTLTEHTANERIFICSIKIMVPIVNAHFMEETLFSELHYFCQITNTTKYFNTTFCLDNNFTSARHLLVSPWPFSKYSSRPLRRASSCCSDREKGHFPGSFGNVKLANSRFKFWCRITNSR